MNMKLAATTLLRIINEHKKDNQLVTITSSECVEFRYRDPVLTPTAAGVICDIDEILTIECAEAHIWFTVFADYTNKNGAEELIVDYSDNPDCNMIADKFAEYFKEDAE